MRVATTVFLGLAVFGCAVDEREGGGQDALPKRGASTADPTILSAGASCSADPGGFDAVAITVSASDLRGIPNLGSCQATIGGVSATGEFSNGNATCYALVTDTNCVEGAPLVVDLVIANDSGGFTTASLTIRP